MRIRPSGSLALALVVLWVSLVGAQRRVLRVPSQYRSIQAAIYAANNRDTVLVAPGVYFENIDFWGKAIAVVSSSGAAVTTINGGNRGSVVAFRNREKRDSVLDGFTIINGAGTSIGSPPVQVLGGGIYCSFSSPTITRNIIINNSAVGTVFPNHALGWGGGIYSFGGSPAIVSNIVAGNRAQGWFPRGGGIYGSGPAMMSGNVVFANSVGPGFPDSSGGGIASVGATVTNNTVSGNTSKHGAGGILADAATVITNTVVWDNQAAYAPELVGRPTTSVTYSNVKGGWPGTGNINADPRFVDRNQNDFHLRYDSPCRNKGSNSAPGIPLTDFEGDPRIADGTADIGADEFFPHLYHTGTATRRGTIQVNLIGKPGNGALFGVSTSVLNPPLSIPGLKGVLYLDPRGLLLVPLPGFPASGVTGFTATIPASFPRVSIPAQGLAGAQLTNLHTVHVR